MIVERLVAGGSLRARYRMRIIFVSDIELHNKGCQQILGKVEQLRQKER